jgi:hypothetical protein
MSEFFVARARFLLSAIRLAVIRTPLALPLMHDRSQS